MRVQKEMKGERHPEMLAEALGQQSKESFRRTAVDKYHRYPQIR